MRSGQSTRHEPGRYFDGIVPGPQTHIMTGEPATGAVQVANVVAVETLHGAIRTVPFAAPRFCAVMVTTPVVAAVAIEATYLLVDEADSQPQPLATAGSTVVVCTVSVMAVRQAEPASTTSETLALTV